MQRCLQVLPSSRGLQSSMHCWRHTCRRGPLATQPVQVVPWPIYGSLPLCIRPLCIQWHLPAQSGTSIKPLTASERFVPGPPSCNFISSDTPKPALRGLSVRAGPLLEMATFTLAKMAAGGMHDHVGGGFHRYSVDELWHVPHFEKVRGIWRNRGCEEPPCVQFSHAHCDAHMTRPTRTIVCSL